jgi:hypothetical protein
MKWIVQPCFVQIFTVDQKEASGRTEETSLIGKGWSKQQMEGGVWRPQIGQLEVKADQQTVFMSYNPPLTLTKPKQVPN